MMTDLRKVLEEPILDSKVELSLREVLGIAKKEFNDSIVDLVKRKRLLMVSGPKLETNFKMKKRVGRYVRKGERIIRIY